MAQTRKPADDSQTEATFNLVNFLETLIILDKQHQEWLAKQESLKENM